MAVVEPYVDHFLCHLKENNQVALCCQTVFQQYHSLLSQLKKQRKELDDMAVENSNLIHEKRRLEEDAKVSRPSGALGDSQRTRVKELEQHITKLEEELKNNYRSIQAHDQAFIQLHNDANDLRNKLEQRNKDIERLQQEVHRLTCLNCERDEQIKELTGEKQKLQEELKEANEGRELLRNEVRSLKEMVDTSTILKLKAENDSMVQRLIEQKMREVETVNEMTELNRQHETKIKLLEAEVEDLKSGKSAKMIEGLRSIRTSDTALMVDFVPTEVSAKLDVHSGECNVATFDPLGNRLATGGTDKRIKVWDTKSFDMLHSFSGPNASVVRLCFSPSGERLLAGCNDSACYVMVVGQNRLFCTLTGHTEKVWGCGFCSDSKVVVTGAHDRSLRWWDLHSSGRCFKTVLCGSSCNDLTVHPGSDLICTAHLDSQIRFWDPRSYKAIHAIDDAFEGQAQVTSVCMTPDSSGILASARDGTLKMFDMRTYEATHTFTCKDMVASINHYKACISPDGRYVAAGSSSRLHANNQTLCVWDMNGKVVSKLKEAHAGPITSCAWHPDGTSMVSTGHDGKLVVWK